jgi:subtilase family serine protease
MRGISPSSWRNHNVKALRLAALVGILAATTALPAWASPAVSLAVKPQLAFRDLGMASAQTPVAIALTLNYRNASQLEQLIAMQNDVRSPYYRHWLTSAQFNAAFAPTAQAYAKAVASLRRAGFRVTQGYVNRTVIDAVGTVGIADRYFRTRIDRVAQPGYGLRFANMTPAQVPPDLQGLVLAVSGLHDLVFIHTDVMPVKRGAMPAALKRRSEAAPVGMFGPPNSLDGWIGYGPLALTRGYDFPSSHAASDDGSGSTVATVNDADFWNTDVAKFLSYFKIKRNASLTTRVSIDGGPGAPNKADGDTVETTLDVETLASLAPGTRLYVYETPNFITGNPKGTSAVFVIDSYNKIVDDNKVDSVNSSFGGCELADLGYSKAVDHLAAQAAALGITFHASSGDSGAFACVTASNQSIVSTQVPASSSHIVAVGGTTLLIDANGTYEGEEGWNSNGGASGGGVSSVFLLPSWQAGVTNIVTNGRNVPDVSFDADPDTGFALYYDGTWNNDFNPAGGTSLSSPIFGGALAQMTQVLHGRLGLAAERLFKLWKSTGYASNGTTYFHDSIFGNNGYYLAGPGYDHVTGIGSVDIWNAMQTLKK